MGPCWPCWGTPKQRVDSTFYFDDIPLLLVIHHHVSRGVSTTDEDDGDAGYAVPCREEDWGRRSELPD